MTAKKEVKKSIYFLGTRLSSWVQIWALIVLMLPTAYAVKSPILVYNILWVALGALLFVGVMMLFYLKKLTVVKDDFGVQFRVNGLAKEMDFEGLVSMDEFWSYNFVEEEEMSGDTSIGHIDWLVLENDDGEKLRFYETSIIKDSSPGVESYRHDLNSEIEGVEVRSIKKVKQFILAHWK